MTTVHIPAPLRKFTGGAAEVTATGETVSDVIEDLERKHGGFKATLCGKDGKVKPFVNIYVNDEDIRFLQNLATPVNDGDELFIVPALAGG